jgi:hypothetical protein
MPLSVKITVEQSAEQTSGHAFRECLFETEVKLDHMDREQARGLACNALAVFVIEDTNKHLIKNKPPPTYDVRLLAVPDADRDKVRAALAAYMTDTNSTDRNVSAERWIAAAPMRVFAGLKHDLALAVCKDLREAGAGAEIVAHRPEVVL